MKNTIKIFTLGVLAALFACEDPELPKPVPATEPSTFAAKFLFVNATPDAPSLDLYINNEKAGASAAVGTAQGTYTTVPITSNAVIANTNIRTKASAGTIGGTLGSNDLIYRAGNNNTNNFTATNGFSYTVIAVDSINRPVPTRTLNASNFGDVTYYSSKAQFVAPSKVGGADTTIVLSVGSNNSVALINTVRKYNSNAIPSFIVPIGIVPLGSSDVGGLRYYLVRDFFPTYTTADLVNKAGIRVINLSPTPRPLKVVLNGAADIAVNGASGASYAMSNAGGFTPTVGSNTPTVSAANFPLQTIVPGEEYAIEVSDASVVVASKAYTFIPGHNYSIIVSGLVGGTGSEALTIIVIDHI